jgi:predicted metallo-beta-lactamase superfamily hydrolase
MRYWTFDPNTCRFERASKQSRFLHAADVAVVNDDTDVQVISDHQPPKCVLSGEPLVVAERRVRARAVRVGM